MNQPADDKQSIECPELPPKLSGGAQVILVIVRILLFASLVYTIEELCLHLLQWPMCVLYVSLVLVPVCVGVELFVMHSIKSHRARVEDASTVDAIFAEARSLFPRLSTSEGGGGGENLPSPYEGKEKNVANEVERLQKLGEEAWTEYQILPLSQMLVEFLKTDDLVSQAHSTLEDLEDYADQDAYGGYDRKHYGQWDSRVQNAIKRIVDYDERNTETPQARERDKTAEPLRATLTTLLEHVASYRKNWAEGSAIYRGLSVFCLVSIPTLLTIGLLPVAYLGVDNDSTRLGLFHWAALGMAGAFTAVLRAFHGSDIVEMGNSDGKRELWRAVHAAVLGLVAGILIFSTIAGGLIATGSAVPILDGEENLKISDIGLTIILAFSAGFFFEHVFEKLRPGSVKE